MNCSYPAIYDSYSKFCNNVGVSPLPFDRWMESRDQPVENKVRSEANKLLHTELVTH